MADHTKCADVLCLRRGSCWRFLSLADRARQSWFAESPRNGDECPYYWPVAAQDKRPVPIDYTPSSGPAHA